MTPGEPGVPTAAQAYEAAITRTANAAERNFLERSRQALQRRIRRIISRPRMGGRRLS
jgi:hypothetical protein